MNAKEYLGQIRIINAKLKSMTRQVRLLQDAIENITTSFGEDLHTSTRNVHRTEDLVIKKLDLENDIAYETKKLAVINGMVNALSDTYRVIITDRYISRMPWSEIANELNISVSRAYQLHRKALVEMSGLIIE